MDDAGISFAYARNLADGYGLTSYPGLPPVEGISNFLWTILLVPFFLLKLFHPVWTPKIIAAVLVSGVFIWNRKIVRAIGFSERFALLVNIFLSINTPFVVWSQSGMENSLFAFLLVVFCYCTMKFVQEQEKSVLNYCAAFAFLVAVTRPEGIFFASLLPLSLLSIDTSLKTKLNYLFNYCLAVLIPVIAFLLFRYSYFNDWLPNTYYAKGRHNAFAVFDLQHAWEKFRYLSFAIGGRWAAFVLLLGLVSFPVLIKHFRKKNKAIIVLILFFLFSFFHFMLMPDDWMGELRFATPFIGFAVLYFGAWVYFIKERFIIKGRFVLAFCFVFLIYSAYHFYNRSMQFAQKPTVPFEYVKRTFADTFNSYSDRLHLKEASVLLPDLGATLYYSKIEVYDASGLCDRVIGRNIYRDVNEVHDYIFESIKPTFIHVHNTWSERLSLDDDERFRNNYLPIYEYEEDSLSKAVGQRIMSGNYIRKEALSPSNAMALDSIITEEKNKGTRW